MKRIKKLRDIFQRLALPQDSLLIVGSTPLSLFNIIREEEISDFDVLVFGVDVWKKVSALGPVTTIETGDFRGERVVYIDKATGETIDFTNGWPMAGKSKQRLFDKKMVIDGLSFMSLEHVIISKISMDREKDRKHLNLVRAWLHEAGADGCEHLPSSIKSRVYRDIARGLAVNIPKLL